MSSATISASGVDTFSDVDVALQADGGFVISWEEQARGPFPISPGNAYPYAILSQGLYVERFDADGQSVTGPVLVSSESGPSFNVANRTGSIDSLPDGQTIIAYLQPPVSGPAPNQITVAMFDANLVASSSPIRISASGLNTFTDVDVAYRADGGFVLTWEGQTRGPLSDTDPDEILSEGVYVQQFASDGQAIAGPVMLSSETGPIFDTTERRTSITPLPDGEALVAYSVGTQP